MSRLNKVVIIKGNRGSGRTTQLFNNIKKQLYASPSSFIIVVSPEIKMREVSEVLKGDNYLAMKVAIVQPLDDRVTYLKNGQVTLSNFEEFEKNILSKNEDDIYLYADDPNLGKSVVFANKLKYNNEIVEVHFSSLPSKVRTCVRELLSINVFNPRNNIEVVDIEL